MPPLQAQNGRLANNKHQFSRAFRPQLIARISIQKAVQLTLFQASRPHHGLQWREINRWEGRVINSISRQSTCPGETSSSRYARESFLYQKTFPNVLLIVSRSIQDTAIVYCVLCIATNPRPRTNLLVHGKTQIIFFATVNKACYLRNGIIQLEPSIDHVISFLRQKYATARHSGNRNQIPFFLFPSCPESVICAQRM